MNLLNTTVFYFHRLNHLRKAEVKPQAAIETLVVLLSPFAPHLCEELWQRLGHGQSIFSQPWPNHNEAFLVSEEVEFVVQINGKVRAKIKTRFGLTEPEIEKAALAEPNIKKRIQGKQILKKIFVSGKLINWVVK